MDRATLTSLLKALDVASALGMGPTGYAVSQAYCAFVCSDPVLVNFCSMAAALECTNHSPKHGIGDPPRGRLAGSSLC